MTPPPIDDELRDDEPVDDGDELLAEEEDLFGEDFDEEDLEDDEGDGEDFYDEEEEELYEEEEEAEYDSAEQELEVAPPAATWAGKQAEAGANAGVDADAAASPQGPAEPETSAVDEKPVTQESEAVPEPQAPGPDTQPIQPVHAAAAQPVAAPQGLTPAEGGVPPGMAVSPAVLEALAEGDDLHPPKPRLLARFLAAAMVIVVSMAAATSISGLLKFTAIAEELGGLGDSIQDRLEQVDGGQPQTILILGSDIRPGEETGRSDTTMLLHLDDDQDLITLMSLPRDLQVNIPGHGVDRLNAAYSYGGPELTLQTVQELTGLQIHHLVNVDFQGFATAVDAIDCVYIDVDRDYFHVNDYGTEQYAEIDIDPGYQRLCGPDALAYVRYRHEDNDIVRGARQQDFLREARAKIPPGELFVTKRDDYLKIFTDYTTSDIDEANELIDLLKLFIDLRNAEVQKVEFHGDIGDATSTYVTASDRQLQTAISKLLGADRSGPKASSSASGGGGGGSGAGKPEPSGGGPDMIDTSASAELFGGKLAKEVNFPVYAPTQLPEGSEYDDDSHAYGVDAPEGETYGGYKLVFNRFGQYGVDEYFGVMGTKWKDPPILQNPSEEREIDGRTYYLFYDGGRLRVVGWKTDEATYWVSNTLTRSLSEPEMLGIATSLTEIGDK